MPADAFVVRLNEQIANEFAAHQQYVACAVFYDAETFPQLARFFYRQALEERDHAMMMVQYLVVAEAGEADLALGGEQRGQALADRAERVDVDVHGGPQPDDAAGLAQRGQLLRRVEVGVQRRLVARLAQLGLDGEGGGVEGGPRGGGPRLPS